MTERVEIGNATRIYALVDPRDMTTRYVGKTIQPLRERLVAHKRDATRCNRPVNRWARKIKDVEFGPIIRLLETVKPGGDWADRERYWIQKYRTAGARLLNQTDGGEGLPGLVFTAAHRKKIAQALMRGAEFHCYCGVAFWRKPSAIKRGQNKFCSRACANKHNKGGARGC